VTVLDRAKQHANAKQGRRIKVPEWGDETGPLVIHYKMLTLEELAVVEEHGGSQFSLQAPYIVAMKAEDAQGNKLFKMTDHLELRESAAPEVVKAIAMAILGRVSIEDAVKN